MSLPRWVARVVWMVRGKRRVRLHLEVGEQTQVQTVEGVLLGRWGGHYVLVMPRAVVGEGSAVPLDGSVEVPASRVVFVQVIP